jgi:tRNA (adenine-N(1)-)-methyltransferase non-catalytic subunit
MRNNRLTVDDGSRQKLSMEEIEELKRLDTGSGKETIAKIVAAHSGIDEKTVFSLAKYIQRKHKKYLRRFTILPLDVNILVDITLEKEPSRIMELRAETLGLLTSWANVHHGVPTTSNADGGQVGGGRWLVVDDTAGLIVAAMAEKMGILYHDTDSIKGQDHERLQDYDLGAEQNGANHPIVKVTSEQSTPEAPNRSSTHQILAQSAQYNTLTVVHPSSQPNLSLLRYFGYVAEDPNEEHPLYTNLKTLTWLQLLNHEADALCNEPTVIPDAELAKMKISKRGNYYRKWRRWQRINSVIEETKAGGFDGCVIASHMKAQSILKHLVPLVRGGGQIVVYSPTIEPLTELIDLYSRERKGAFVRQMQQQGKDADETKVDRDDFPLNPTLLLNPMVQTTRVRHWQALPGRTHPLMTGRGGAEGFIFTAVRVHPASGKIEARGKFAKKRKIDDSQEQSKKKMKACAQLSDEVMETE